MELLVVFAELGHEWISTAAHLLLYLPTARRRPQQGAPPRASMLSRHVAGGIMDWRGWNCDAGCEIV
jgi:hypothetical protein